MSLVAQGNEDALNAMIAFVRGLEAKDSLEAALATQMAAVHALTMRLAGQLSSSTTHKGQEHAERALNKLARTFASQVETLKRYRMGGEQKVTVQHVTVSDNAQAIVGNVSAGGGDGKKSEANPMKAQQDGEYAFRESPRCTATSKRTRQRCKAPAVRGWNVCRFHGARGGAPPR